MELTGHLTEDVLIAYFSGELDVDRMKKVETHIIDCLPCQRRFNIFKMLFAGLITIIRQGQKQASPEKIKTAMQQNLKKNQIFYTILHIPDFTSLLIAKSALGVVRIILGDFTHFEFEEKLKKDFPRQWIVESLDKTETERRQIEQYLFQERTEFELDIDPVLIRSDFQKKVLFALRDIPYGHFTTYGELARKIGKPKATRAVGTALGKNPLPIILPCHRVIRGNGELGGFTGGVHLKRKLLELEGASYSYSPQQLDLFKNLG